MDQFSQVLTVLWTSEQEKNAEMPALNQMVVGANWAGINNISRRYKEWLPLFNDIMVLDIIKEIS